MLQSIITLAAVLALAGLNWWLGRTGRLARDPGPASARLKADLIDFAETEGEAANDGKAYIAAGARAPETAAPGHAAADLAVAVARGDSWVTRRLGAGALLGVTRDDARLQLRTGDFTLPSIDLRFSDPARASYWEAQVRGTIARRTTSAPAAPPSLQAR